MATYNLEILAYGSYLIDNPQLTIWNDGFIDTNHLIKANGTTIDRNLTYSGALPSSVFFYF